MVKKLTKHGNSLALVIDRPVLDLLKIDADTPLDISTDGERLIIAPTSPASRKQKFDRAQEWPTDATTRRSSNWPMNERQRARIGRQTSEAPCQSSRGGCLTSPRH
jgi:antitoxin component of MazEF toxin-antitoxin module